MNDIRAWLDKGDRTSERMPMLLPLLIRQARLETAISRTVARPAPRKRSADLFADLSSG